MKAAFCTGPLTFEVRDVAQPTPGSTEAVVRVRSCGICGSDLHAFHGSMPPLPVCPGHEVSGEVVAVGGSPSHVRPGDRVAVEPCPGCRECWCCRSGNYQLCRNFRSLGMTEDGGFAEYVRVPLHALYPLPAGIDFEIGSLAEPLAVGVHAVRLGNIHAGDRVAVLGAGSIGLLTVAAAKAAGATEVWVTARHPHQRAAAELLGASRVFSGPDAGTALRDAASQEWVDTVIETVGGTADTVDEAVDIVRPAGSVIVLGVFTTKPSFNALALMMKEVRITGSMTYNRPGPQADFDVALQLLAAEPERYRRLITHRFPLEQITQGFEAAADKRSGSIKVSIRPAD
ncbi:MAG: theronine dehydrogenase-like Zn-dependent dehydrogenase [Deltaproteobacteria bacterium]|nr:theronine dehydrogenase-like Zn-dependent dehydrogenase [Deltaproteobacteria bacterium]